MKLFYSILALLLFSTTLYSQDSLQTKIVSLKEGEQMPEGTVAPVYPGGIMAFKQYLVNKIENHIPRQSGRIIVSFVVEKDGTLSTISFKNSDDKNLEKHITKALQKSPKWYPGIIDGKPIRAQYNMPLSFKP